MKHKQKLILSIAQSLRSYGFTVYVAKSGGYGFYTDGVRCVSFGGQWNWSVDFSGNYLSESSGTGWQIATEKTCITEDAAKAYIKANAPRWATVENVRYTTHEQHLKTYGASSGYTVFEEGAQKLEWQPLWDAMDASPELWIPTTEKMYWDMLECVPPRKQSRNAFLVGEPLRHNENGEAVHACFRQLGDEFHARNLTVKQFDFWMA